MENRIIHDMNELYEIIEDFVKIKNIITNSDPYWDDEITHAYNKIKEIMQKYEV